MNERLTETEGRITKLVDSKMDEIAALINKPAEKPQYAAEGNKGFKRRDMSTVECFKYHGFGHYARDCEWKGENVEASPANHVQENWD